jgi:hypothetical protein
MKKIFSLIGLILFLLALSLVSCEKKENNADLLIGKWDAVSSKITYYEDDVKVDEETINFLPGESAMEFLEGGTGNSYTNDTLAGTFTWEVDGDLLIVNPNSGGTIGAKIDINGDTMTLMIAMENTSGSVVYRTISEAIYTRI